MSIVCLLLLPCPTLCISLMLFCFVFTYNSRSWMTVYLDAPVNDPDIDDVPSSAEFPGMSPSSTLGLSTTLPDSPSSNNSNPITPSIPPVSSVPSIGPPPGLALPTLTLGYLFLLPYPFPLPQDSPSKLMTFFIFQCG